MQSGRWKRRHDRTVSRGCRCLTDGMEATYSYRVTQILCGQQTIVTRRGSRLFVSPAEPLAMVRRVGPRSYGQEVRLG